MITVVGAGLAGLRTVEQLRRRGYSGKIVLYGDERHLPYDRPPLSKQVLRGERDSVWLRRDNDFTGLDIELRLDEAVTGLDAERAVLKSVRGEQGYDVLVIATGAIARRIPGIAGYALRTLDDAHGLRAQLTSGRRLAVIGAGLIGCEVAASARSLGLAVTILDVLDGPMIRVVGPEVAQLVADLHRSHGVELRLNAAVTASSVDRLSLADGSEVECDLVLEAIGAAPNTAWLADSSIVLSDGVVCDDNGLTAPGIYAVGDVARWGGRRHEHWTNATEQAEIVAAAIVGDAPPPHSVSYWWSDQYDLKLQGLGHPNPTDDVTVLSWGPKERTLAVYSNAGRLTGVVGFSAGSAVVRMRSHIAAGTDVQSVLAELS